jgi:hypothetical protein
MGFLMACATRVRPVWARGHPDAQQHPLRLGKRVQTGRCRPVAAKHGTCGEHVDGTGTTSSSSSSRLDV